MKKILATVGASLTSVAVFAEGESALPLDLTQTFTGYITAGQTAIISLLTAGAVIVAVFVAYKWLKKAFNRAG